MPSSAERGSSLDSQKRAAAELDKVSPMGLGRGGTGGPVGGVWKPSSTGRGVPGVRWRRAVADGSPRSPDGAPHYRRARAGMDDDREPAPSPVSTALVSCR